MTYQANIHTAPPARPAAMIGYDADAEIRARHQRLTGGAVRRGATPPRPNCLDKPGRGRVRATVIVAGVVAAGYLPVCAAGVILGAGL